MFTQFGIGSDEASFLRIKEIFKFKNYSDPSLPFPRDFEKDIYTETDFIDFKVKSEN